MLPHLALRPTASDALGIEALDTEAPSKSVE